MQYSITGIAGTGGGQGLLGTRVKGGLLRLGCFTNDVQDELASEASGNASHNMHDFEERDFLIDDILHFGTLLVTLLTNQDIKPPSFG